jgi:hypothetical protein
MIYFWSFIAVMVGVVVGSVIVSVVDLFKEDENEYLPFN